MARFAHAMTSGVTPGGVRVGLRSGAVGERDARVRRQRAKVNGGTDGSNFVDKAAVAVKRCHV
eukprot:CAMPEP_0171982542 /NCGR_PEP_ID=MMETSP0993-20121228/271810_1 /TAXON_ID=483369 /ORGANISM="non described non described, Strain CCMP2098" /LENGTH=62 /DNA_ID=CAMNT_0012635177 /DNA_START=25 /DNA_END=212 /DNA_ORIENTATION=+